MVGSVRSVVAWSAPDAEGWLKGAAGVCCHGTLQRDLMLQISIAKHGSSAGAAWDQRMRQGALDWHFRLGLSRDAIR